MGIAIHPSEHVLQLSKADLLALPEGIGRFKGFYTRSGNFILMSSTRLLVDFAARYLHTGRDPVCSTR